MNVRSGTYGGLSCRVVDDLPAGVAPQVLCVLCHGFGASGEDLVGLGPALLAERPELAGQVRFVFPAAPISLGDMGWGDARAWWMIDFDRLAKAMRLGEAGVLAYQRDVPEGLDRARKLLRAALDELAREVPIGKTVIGGFSQGAMLTTDVTLRLEEPPAALAILSGTLIARDDWEKRAPARAGLRVLQAHGRADPILPFWNATALRDLLGGAGLRVDFLEFPGEHTIPAEALGRLGELLASV